MLLGKIRHFGLTALWRITVVAGAAVLTLLTFLVLPLMQSINKPPVNQTVFTDLSVANIPPPPPPPEPEPEEEEEPEPELEDAPEDLPPLDLSQLELILGDGLGAGVGGDFAVKINTPAETGGSDAIFNESDLDQRPRTLYQPGPQMTPRVRKAGGGQVFVIFIVDERGRVQDARVQRSTNPILDTPALNAVKQWKFEPGKRRGEPVRFRMRVPVTFPKG